MTSRLFAIALVASAALATSGPAQQPTGTDRGVSLDPRAPAGGPAQQDKADPLPSWNDGPAKKAILEFVRATTDKASPKFVPPEQRIATFDQDGTLWVEHPMYTQVVYCLERVGVVAKQRPELKNVEPFKTVLSGDRAAIADRKSTRLNSSH